MNFNEFEFRKSNRLKVKKVENRKEIFIPPILMSQLSLTLAKARNTLPTYLSIWLQYNLNQKKEFRFSYTTTSKYFGICKSTAQKHIKKLDKIGAISVKRARGSAPRVDIK